MRAWLEVLDGSGFTKSKSALLIAAPAGATKVGVRN